MITRIVQVEDVRKPFYIQVSKFPRSIGARHCYVSVHWVVTGRVIVSELEMGRSDTETQAISKAVRFMEKFLGSDVQKFTAIRRKVLIHT